MEDFKRRTKYSKEEWRWTGKVRMRCYYDELEWLYEVVRMETDKEVEQRVKRSERAKTAAATRKQKQEEEERRLYERLKEKFDSAELPDESES